MKKTMQKFRTTWKRFLIFLAPVTLGLFLSIQCGPAASQDYPSRSIRFIVPFPPGSGTDATARYYANELSNLTKQSGIVENKPGADGFIAVASFLSAAADGYTVLIGSTSTLATTAALFRTLPYDPIHDFLPITMMMGSSVILLVPASSPYSTLSDLIGDAKRRPDALQYASGAASYQLMSEWFNELAQIKTSHIPYKGAAEAVRATMSGEVAFTLVDTTTGLTALQSQKVKALGVGSNQRQIKLPRVPTIVEGGLRNFTAYTWVGAVLPANTPVNIAGKLTALMSEIAQRPQTREFLEKSGMEVLPIGPEAFRQFQQDNIALWRRVSKSANIEPR